MAFGVLGYSAFPDRDDPREVFFGARNNVNMLAHAYSVMVTITSWPPGWPQHPNPFIIPGSLPGDTEDDLTWSRAIDTPVGEFTWFIERVRTSDNPLVCPGVNNTTWDGLIKLSHQPSGDTWSQVYPAICAGSSPVFILPPFVFT